MKYSNYDEVHEAVKLVLNGSMPISVRLHDSQGRPVAQVKVAPWEFRKKKKKGLSDSFCFRTALVEAVSDTQGRVQFDWLPADLEWVSFSVDDGDYHYPVRAASHIPSVAGKDGRFALQRYQRGAGYVYAGIADANLACLQAIAEDENDVTIVTDKAATVVGRVVDAAGRPLSGMSVGCHFFPPQMRQRETEVWAETDKEGKYKLSTLVPGWHGEMYYHRSNTEHHFEIFKGPKIVVQSGENNLGDTIPQPVDQEPNDPSNTTSAKVRSADREPVSEPGANHDETKKVSGKNGTGVVVRAAMAFSMAQDQRILPTETSSRARRR